MEACDVFDRTDRSKRRSIVDFDSCVTRLFFAGSRSRVSARNNGHGWRPFSFPPRSLKNHRWRLARLNNRDSSSDDRYGRRRSRGSLYFLRYDRAVVRQVALSANGRVGGRDEGEARRRRSESESSVVESGISTLRAGQGGRDGASDVARRGR